MERISAQDQFSLVTDIGPVPMQVGAVLWLDGSQPLDRVELIARLGPRVATVPRLRQVLRDTPPGCGRPLWVDHAAFRLGEHVEWATVPSFDDERAVLAVAVDAVERRLDRTRPLWRLVVVRGRDDGRSALVFAFHHVLADGIGGLAVLANLVDPPPGLGPVVGPPSTEAVSFPRPAPSRRALVADRARQLVASARGLPSALTATVLTIRALVADPPPKAAPCSLLDGLGANRRLAVARTDLAGVRAAGHAAGATVNDLVLVAVTGALGDVLAERGEHVDQLVVSVPVSSRTSATVVDIGNHVGAVPIAVPAAGTCTERLRETAARTRAAKQRAASGAVAAPMAVLRLLGRLHVLGWFLDHQRMVHTFVTNLRGPDERFRFLGREVVDAAPIVLSAGNVALSFSVLSYAGQVDVAVSADTDVVPELDALLAHLEVRLADVRVEGSPAVPG